MTRNRTEREFAEACIARDVTGGCCQYPDCGCFDASDYWEDTVERAAADLWRRENPTMSVFSCDAEMKKLYRARALKLLSTSSG